MKRMIMKWQFDLNWKFVDSYFTVPQFDHLPTNNFYNRYTA